MNETIVNRLSETRNMMKAAGVDVYMVCTNDYHMSEYTGDYFNEREFLSGFDGSAGTLVISAERAVLFTDGRYFVQAKKQLDGTSIQLMAMGCAGVPELEDYCVDEVPEGGVIGMDGRMVSAVLGLDIEDRIKSKSATINYEFNPTLTLWRDRPSFPASKAFNAVFGQTSRGKIEELRGKFGDADGIVLATLDDICWLYNVRGRDVACNPVIMSYAYITKNAAYMYTDSDRLPEDVINELSQNDIIIEPYDEFYDDLTRINGRIMVDYKRVNLCIYKKLEAAGATIIRHTNPTVLMKAVKNQCELDNLTDVHIEDGAALTHFICWLKKSVDEGASLTEAEAAEYLDGLRAEISDYIEPSFDTISAYGANAAMMHYHAGNNSAPVKKGGMLLVDSGGQYMRGTTDVTRTIALGDISSECKRHFTLVLKGMLRLTHAHFLEGCSGYSLDILAREPLWEEGMDYRCGTGHGVGYLLNVHESPNAFRWKYVPGRTEHCVLEPGMVTSNEPGVYIEDAYGIRTENEIVVEKDYENEYGTWLRFRTLTCAPIDLDAVDVTLLSENERAWLNEYHEWVRQKLTPYFEGNELEWLEKATRAV